MPRFVLLYHECPAGFSKPTHWDLMLEADGVLETWELRELPVQWLPIVGADASFIDQTLSARRLPDHRLAYLSFEGPLTDNRGNVTRVAEGDFQVLESDSERRIVVLSGSKTAGEIRLMRITGTDDWQLSVAN